MLHQLVKEIVSAKRPQAPAGRKRHLRVTADKPLDAMTPSPHRTFEPVFGRIIIQIQIENLRPVRTVRVFHFEEAEQIDNLGARCAEHLSAKRAESQMLKRQIMTR